MTDFSSLWAIEMLIAAFAGGAFGAAVGALPAFIFTGFMVIAGEAANVAGRYIAAAGPGKAGQLGAVGITGTIAFGPVFSPAISFAAGTAAAAYAAKRGYMETGFDFHEAKNIAFAQGTKPDVLVVGGLFGILGYWFVQLSTIFGMPYDPIAMGVVLSAVAHRLVFGYSIIGNAKKGILNMSPFESEDRRIIGEPAVDGGESDAGGSPETDGGTVGSRFLVEPWLPHQYKWANVATLGLVVGNTGRVHGLRDGKSVPRLRYQRGQPRLPELRRRADARYPPYGSPGEHRRAGARPGEHERLDGLTGRNSGPNPAPDGARCRSGVRRHLRPVRRGVPARLLLPRRHAHGPARREHRLRHFRRRDSRRARRLPAERVGRVARDVIDLERPRRLFDFPVFPIGSA